MANRMKILVGYDGSKCADAALDDLRRAGLPADAQVKVLSVVENWLPPPSGLEIIEPTIECQPPAKTSNACSSQMVMRRPST